MEKYEVLSLFIGFTNIGVIATIAIVTNFNSKKLKDIEEKNLKLNEAQTELYIQELIMNARKLILDITLEKLKLEVDSENKSQSELIEALMSHTLQEVLNSFEIACSKYLDDKVDKKRFKKTYIREITELFSIEAYKILLTDTNSYQAIKKVNNEWNNHEK